VWDVADIDKVAAVAVDQLQRLRWPEELALVST
jgi:hypothetical protein